jgi:hypothetical protein
MIHSGSLSREIAQKAAEVTATVALDTTVALGAVHYYVWSISIASL